MRDGLSLLGAAAVVLNARPVLGGIAVFRDGGCDDEIGRKRVERTGDS
jgi:hypothetical protein